MEWKQTHLQAELLQLSGSEVGKISTIPKIALVNQFHSFAAPLSTEPGATSPQDLHGLPTHILQGSCSYAVSSKVVTEPRCSGVHWIGGLISLWQSASLGYILQTRSYFDLALDCTILTLAPGDTCRQVPWEHNHVLG